MFTEARNQVKVTKFCASLEELIIVYKLTKFDSCIINGLWETKLNATAKRNCWRRKDRQTDGQTDRRTDRRFSPIQKVISCDLFVPRSDSFPMNPEKKTVIPWNSILTLWMASYLTYCSTEYLPLRVSMHTIG